MAKRFALVFVNWLLGTHMLVAWAGTTIQPQRVHAFMACRGNVEGCSMAPKVIFPAASGFVDQPLFTTTTLVQDNANQYRDVAESKTKQRAWLYSALLPGWGQVYNQQYWKVPAIYAGFSGLIVGTVYYHHEYMKSKERLVRARQTRSVQSYVDMCRQGRDLCAIFAILWYVANIFDAYVGASLKTFTLSDDVSMRVQPSVFPAMHQEAHVGLSLTLSLRGCGYF